MKSLQLIKEIFANRDYCKKYIKKSDNNVISVTFKKNLGINIVNNNSKKLMDTIPTQYIELLKFSDGIELYNYENVDGLVLFGLNEMIHYTQYAKNTYDEEWQDNIVIFAKIIGEDNYLGFRIKDYKYEILDCYFEEAPLEWRTISNDFDDFLVKYIHMNGEKFWI